MMSCQIPLLSFTGQTVTSILLFSLLKFWLWLIKVNLGIQVF